MFWLLAWFFVLLLHSNHGLVLLIHSCPLGSLHWSPIPFKLQFYVFTTKFGIDITTNDVPFNNIIHETQTLHPNEILWGGPNEKGFIFLFTIIWACCVANDLVVDLTIRTCRFQFMASSNNLVFDFCYLCSNFWFFIHAKFSRTSIKACWGANKHILALEGDKKLFECVLKPMAIVCLHDNHGFAQLHVKLQMILTLMMMTMTCPMSHTSRASTFIL